MTRTPLYLSNLFCFTEQFNIKGHKIGRKTGDLLELLVLGAIYNNENLKQYAVMEGILEGFTTAKHKIKFGLHPLSKNNLPDSRRPFGIIECKKVGVEVTKLRKHPELSEKSEMKIEFTNRWLKKLCRYKIQADSVDESQVQLSVYFNEEFVEKLTMKCGEKLKFVLDRDGETYFLKPQEAMYDMVKKQMASCKIVELAKISEHTSKFNLYNCLPGPQTIEKAKQVAFVSMDLRKKFNEIWDALPISEDASLFKSILVIGEYSHWEQKSINIVKKCIDHILVVPDDVLIELYKTFMTLGDNYLNCISKDKMKDDSKIQEIVTEHAKKYYNNMFYDITQKCFVYIDFDGKTLVCHNVSS